MTDSGSKAPVTRGHRGSFGLSALMAALSLILTLGLVACDDDTPEAATDAAPPVGAAEESATATPAATTSDLSSLDAATIVAAQEQVFAGIYESVLPSVVRIRVRRPAQQSPDGVPNGSIIGEGSGFVWSKAGYIVTNNHIVSNATQVLVIFSDRTEVAAEVVGTDPHSDLAVLRVDMLEDRLHPVTVGDSDALKVGQVTLAIGNPFGQQFTMTQGIVSAVGRMLRSQVGQFSIPEVIQTDAPINPGNSGGPLLDRQGRVIGIVSQIRSENGVSAGIGFAIPINIAVRVVPELIATGVYTYAYLGISGDTLTPTVAKAMGLPEDTRGALITQVLDGTPAQRAGLVGSTRTRQVNGAAYPVGGDVITKVDGTAIDGMGELIAHLVRNNRPGDEVVLTVVRGRGRIEHVALVVAARPVRDSPASPSVR